jgi:hypothetical protein
VQIEGRNTVLDAINSLFPADGVWHVIGRAKVLNFSYKVFNGRKFVETIEIQTPLDAERLKDATNKGYSTKTCFVVRFITPQELVGYKWHVDAEGRFIEGKVVEVEAMKKPNSKNTRIRVRI